MRLGISTGLEHSSPEDWAAKMESAGCGSVVFPVDYTAAQDVILEYASAAKAYGLAIAEVGVWCNPISPNEAERQKAVIRCKEQLRLADAIGANCCVNVAGAVGGRWDGGYKDNFSPETWDKTVKSIQGILDEVNPVNAFYAVEPMPWMIPCGPDQYLELINAVDRPRFAAHMDICNWITSPNRYFFNEAFIEECFRKLGAHIKSCHLKDVRLREEYTFMLEETACGQGSISLEKYAEAALKIDPDMPFIIEHLGSDSEYLESLAYVKKRMSAVGLAQV
jgi:sugar phosphate isomerase/epimerase